MRSTYLIMMSLFPLLTSSACVVFETFCFSFFCFLFFAISRRRVSCCLL